MERILPTICALATPPGFGAIAIVRVSGKETFPIMEKIFIPNNPEKKFALLPSYSLIRGEIIDPEKQELVDEVLLALYRSPNSYTGEDMVEIFAHGGFYCSEKIISLLLRYGAKPAPPGEFTRRRFLAGKIDLTQAEGVLALTSARTELQARAALKQLKGILSAKITEVGEEMKELLAAVENEIEFEEKETVSLEKFQDQLRALSEKISHLLAKGEREIFIKEGVRCPIIGKANVGKSSLFNRLLEKERALVTEIPGTTRDAIEETFSLQGIPFRLIDTCGLRKRKGRLEALGWQKTRDYLADADLVIVVLDGSRPLTAEDKMILDLTAQKRRIIVKNKSDLKPRWSTETNPPPIPVSCKEGTGIEELKEEMKREFLNGEDEFYLSEMRHYELLKKSATALNRAATASYLEILAYELKTALSALSEITGATTTEEVLERIFSRFCIGK
jgi:tRNA modification GTPase